MKEAFRVQISGFTRYFRDASEEKLSCHGNLNKAYEDDPKIPLEIKKRDKSIFISEIEIGLHTDIVDVADKTRNYIEGGLDDDGDPYAHAQLWIPSEQFSALRDASQPIVTIEFYIPKDRSFNAPSSEMNSTRDYFWCDVTGISVSFLEYRFVPLTLTNDEIVKAVEQWVLDIRTQIGQIGAELVKSRNAWLEQNPKDQNGRDEYLDSIRDLIGKLRHCHFFYNGPEDKEDADLWSEILDLTGGGSIHPESFLNIIEGHSEDKKRAKRQI